MLAGAATTWGDRDPVAAATVVIQELPSGRAQDDALVGIAQRWAEQDPENSARWVGQFPAGELRDAASDSVVAIWSQSGR
jgi:hypothetical protein